MRNQMAKILLTSNYCGGCAEAKKMLKKEGIKYREVEADSPEGEKLAKKHKLEYVPAMIINGKVVHDIDKWFR
ncbi:MAG: glutaredoxin domain-containing protein [Methanobacteriota archaeon]